MAPSRPAGASWPGLLAAIALVWALSACFTFLPWWHAHGLYLRDAVRLDQKPDALSEAERLAGAWSREDEERPGVGLDRRAL